MKGIVFTLIGEMVESKYGLETWDKIVEQMNFSHGGAYTAGGTYPLSEFTFLITKLSEIINIPAPQCIQMYGEYMFQKLSERYPSLVPEELSLKEFLKTIDSIIHVEVLKLYPTAQLPSFSYEEPSANELIMIYKSPRKLCILAKGLITGAAQHFQEKIKIAEPLCMHKGEHHCRLEITFLGNASHGHK